MLSSEIDQTSDDDYNTDYLDYVLCSTVASNGFSCVPSNQCKVGHASELSIDIRTALTLSSVEKPICEDVSQICCHESNIKVGK